MSERCGHQNYNSYSYVDLLWGGGGGGILWKASIMTSCCGAENYSPYLYISCGGNFFGNMARRRLLAGQETVTPAIVNVAEIKIISKYVHDGQTKVVFSFEQLKLRKPFS